MFYFIHCIDRIAPICLPTSEELQSHSFVGRMPFVGNYHYLSFYFIRFDGFAFLAGWGRLEEKAQMTNLLHQVQIPVITNDECKNVYEDAGRFMTGLEYRFNETYVLCAGFTSGGKLLCN